MNDERINVNVECSDCAFCSDNGLGCKIFDDVPMICENYLDKSIKDSGLLDDGDIF